MHQSIVSGAKSWPSTTCKVRRLRFHESMFDLQVNGYAGTDFNRDGLTAEALHHACECLGEDGVEGILATVITDDLDAMCRRLRAVAELRERDPLAKQII